MLKIGFMLASYRRVGDSDGLVLRFFVLINEAMKTNTWHSFWLIALVDFFNETMHLLDMLCSQWDRNDLLASP